MRKAWREYAVLDSRIWTLAGARAVNTMGLSLVMAFMAIYLVTERGLSGTITGALYAGANVLQAYSQGWAGSFSDRAGRRVVMVFALFARAAIVPTVGTLVALDAPVWAIVVALSASWTVRGWFEPVAFAAVADIARPGQRVAAFGLQKVGVNLGWAIGPAVGGLLMRTLDYGTVFFCSAPIIVVAALAVARIREPERTAPADRTTLAGSFGDLSANRLALLFLGCAVLSGLVHGQLFSTFSIYVKGAVGLHEDSLGVLWLVNGLLVIALQLPAVIAIERIGVRAALVVGPMLYALSFLAIGAASSLVALAAAIAVLTIGEVIQDPAQQTTAATMADPQRMGRAMGLLGKARMLGLAFSLQIGGLAYDHFRDQPLAMWAVIAAIALALAVGHAVFGAVSNRHATESS
jgi:predicted MFS family arabinose efflux permease